LLAGTLSLLMYTLNKVEFISSNSFLLWLILPIVFIILFIFVFQQTRVKNPLIPYDLLENKQYVAVLVGFTIYEINFGTFFVLQGFYLQNVLKYSPMEAGNVFLAFTIALGALSPIGGKLIDKLGARWPICLGLTLSGLSFVLATFLDEKSTLTYILAIMLLNGIGMGISFPAFNSLIMKILDEEHLSIGSSVFIMGSTLGNTIGVVGSTSLLTIFGTQQITSISSQYNARVLECLARLLSSAHPNFNAVYTLDENSKIEVMVMFQHIFVKSMSSIMLISIFLTLIIFILSCVWIRYRPISYTSAHSNTLLKSGF